MFSDKSEALGVIHMWPDIFYLTSAGTLEWWDAVLQKRLAWSLFVLLLSTLVCCQPTELILCLFCYINCPIIPPPQCFLSCFMLQISVRDFLPIVFIEISFISPPPPQTRPYCTPFPTCISICISYYIIYINKYTLWRFFSTTAYTQGLNYEYGTVCEFTCPGSATPLYQVGNLGWAGGRGCEIKRLGNN